MLEYNLVTITLVLGFCLPVLAGSFDRFSRERIQQAVWSVINNLEFLVGIILAIYLTRKIFFDNDSGIFAVIYGWIPEAFRTYLYGKDIVIYILVVPLLLMMVRTLLRLVMSPVYKGFFGPLTNGLYKLHNTHGNVGRRLMGAVSQLPKAILLVFCLGLFFNFYAYYFPSQLLSRWMNDSPAYQIVYDNAVSPALNSNIAKKIPVLVSDSFGKAAEMVPTGNGTDSAVNPIKKANPYVITYFNGVTLDEAIKSNVQIDETARKIVGNETNSKKKAYLLYKWVSQNIAYDYKKAALINSNTSGISSGSIIAFNTRKGICFDYSSLYISMCRATGLKVRLITGLGYSGIAWGDHAWNQVFCSEENRWINVDTTFGTNGNYFDKRDFNVDHRYAEIQGEW